MLEQMRKSSQSLLIYILFGIVIAVFIINFGPQSQGGCQRVEQADTFGLSVGDETVASNEFNFAFALASGRQRNVRQAKAYQLRERVMDTLIERELLAQEGERLGFRVTNEEIEDMIAESKMISPFGGSEQSLPGLQKNGHFNYEKFKNFVQWEMGMSPKGFIEEQKRELLANRVRELLRAGVTVSPEEVKAEFERRGRQVNVEYLRFGSYQYENQIAPTAKEIEAYAAAHTAKLEELYKQRKFFYDKAPRELHLRQIVIKTEPAAKKPESKDEAKAEEKPAPSAADAAAEKKINDAAARIRKGEAFAAVARQTTEDPRSRARGGDIGWRRKGATALGNDIEEKVFAAKAGDLIGPLKGAEGWYLLTVEGSREGDITFEQAKLELAEDEMRKEQATARAKADAEAALAKIKAAPDKSLKDLFPAPAEDKKPDPFAPPVVRAEETGLISRQGNDVMGLGSSKELANAVFGLKADAPVAGPFEVSGGLVVVRLKERKDPDMAELEKKKDELQNTAQMVKGWQVLSQWTQNRCVQAKQARQIKWNAELLKYEDEGSQAAQQQPQQPKYEPCTPRSRF